MLHKREKDNLLNYIQNKGYSKRTILYHCVSGYPVPIEETCLLEIALLMKETQNLFEGIGFSGHHEGVKIDTVAIALGARYIERHLTLSHYLKGTDHIASLEPEEFFILVENGNEILKALIKKPSSMMKIEEIQRKKLKWNR